jgi:hypothetical protein
VGNDGQSHVLKLCLGCCLCRFLRLPLQCNPEAVLVQTGLEAPSVTAFLHENIPDFIADDGMQSAADILGYITSAGWHIWPRMPVPIAPLSCFETVGFGLILQHQPHVDATLSVHVI